MQFRVKDYDRAVHDMWMALTVPQPDADYLCKPVCLRNDGTWAACKSSLELPFDTDFRGDLLIVSSKSKTPIVHPPFVTVGLVEVESIIKCEDGMFLWKFGNPRMVVPFPAKGPKNKLWSYICPRDEVTPYPRIMKV